MTRHAWRTGPAGVIGRVSLSRDRPGRDVSVRTEARQTVRSGLAGRFHKNMPPKRPYLAGSPMPAGCRGPALVYDSRLGIRTNSPGARIDRTPSATTFSHPPPHPEVVGGTARASGHRRRVCADRVDPSGGRCKISHPLRLHALPRGRCRRLQLVLFCRLLDRQFSQRRRLADAPWPQHPRAFALPVL